MKKTFLLVLFLLSVTFFNSYAQVNDINLIIRADDIGSSHAANIACIKSYQEGIAKSVEIMVPCAWFEEAVKMLNENPGFDVGVHLTLTSEWQYIKWRPVACVPSLTNKEGYFFPFLWTNSNYSAGNALIEAKWDIDEIEKEFRAQIELAKSKLPQLSHISGHMGCTDFTPDVAKMTEKLAKEYNLNIDLDKLDVKYAGDYNKSKADNLDGQIDNFIKMLDNLTPGTWLFVEHPGLNVQEMQAIGHIGYENVAQDRQGVTDIFTSPKVKEAIAKKGIHLKSYGDYKK